MWKPYKSELMMRETDNWDLTSGTENTRIKIHKLKILYPKIQETKKSFYFGLGWVLVGCK